MLSGLPGIPVVSLDPHTKPDTLRGRSRPEAGSAAGTDRGSYPAPLPDYWTTCFAPTAPSAKSFSRST